MNLLDRRFLNISLSVIAIANEPDDNPSTGSQYIVGTNPVGAFENASPNQIARFDGSNWIFLTPKAGQLEVLNLDTSEILQFNGSAWIVLASFGGGGSTGSFAPVLSIIPSGEALPDSATTGDLFLNTTDAKLYSATDTDTWNEGSATASGDCYASSTDFKIYSSDGSTLIPVTVPAGGSFLNKADGFIYVFDGETFLKASNNTFPVIFTEYHSLTEQEVEDKSFSLSHNIAEGHEDNTLLFVSGIAQIVGVDFSAEGNSISWDNKALDAIPLDTGDTFLVQYYKA